MKLKEESEKVVLKLNIQKTKIGILSHHFMANNEETMETVGDFIFWAQKSLQMVTATKIKRFLLLGRKAMTNLDSILKAETLLPNKIHLVKSMVFPVVMYGCECWTIKKTERWRIDGLNYGVGEDSLDSLGLQGDSTSPS